MAVVGRKTGPRVEPARAWAHKSRELLPKGFPANPGKVVKGKGGVRSGERKRLRRLLGLWRPAGTESAPPDHPAGPYLDLATEFLYAHVAELALHVGGGQVGVAAAGAASTAALQMAASRMLFDLGFREQDPQALKDAARLADSSRQNLLAAHELAARDAQARAQRQAMAAPDLDRLLSVAHPTQDTPLLAYTPDGTQPGAQVTTEGDGVGEGGVSSGDGPVPAEGEGVRNV